MSLEDRTYTAADAEVLPMWGAYDTAMRETCSRTPDTRECREWVYCKKYPEAWTCERSVLREAVKDLGEKVLYFGTKTVADTFFWIARQLRR